MNTLETGFEAEKTAELFLQKNGLRKITQNFRTRFGEIDLIMQDKQSLVFVEVRLRRNPFYGQGIETINRAKQRRLIQSAQIYLMRHQQFKRFACRFDVLGLDAKDKITWIKNAFQVDY